MCNFQLRSLRFLPKKETCENRFFPVSFLGENFRERDCATLLKANFFKDIFQEF